MAGYSESHSHTLLSISISHSRLTVSHDSHLTDAASRQPPAASRHLLPSSLVIRGSWLVGRRSSQRRSNRRDRRRSLVAGEKSSPLFRRRRCSLAAVCSPLLPSAIEVSLLSTRVERNLTHKSEGAAATTPKIERSGGGSRIAVAVTLLPLCFISSPARVHPLSFSASIHCHSLAAKIRVMGGGRKNLKRAKEDDHVTLQDGQSIMKVLSLRGSNLIEVMDARGDKSLALFPAKFQKSMWMKQGSFVVVDESAKEKALESGCKVACVVSQVLFFEQVRALKKSPEWPEIFKSEIVDGTNRRTTSRQENKVDKSDDDDDDDGLPPLEANTNRLRPFEWQADEDSESNSDTDT